MTTTQRQRTPRVRKYQTRHLRVDLYDRLRALAFSRRVQLETIVNDVIKRGLDAIDRDAA